MRKQFSVFALVLSLMVAIPATVYATSSGGIYSRTVFSSTNVTTSAYVQLFASTVKGVKAISVLNTGSAPIKVAFGAAGSEVDQIVVAPSSSSGVNGPVVYPLAAGYATRISVESLVQTNSTGELDVNLLYN